MKDFWYLSAIVMFCLTNISSVHAESPEILLGAYEIREGKARQDILNITRYGADFYVSVFDSGSWTEYMAVSPMTREFFETQIGEQPDSNFVGLNNDSVAIMKISDAQMRKMKIDTPYLAIIGFAPAALYKK